MADGAAGEIRQFLIALAEDPVDEITREDLIRDIGLLQDELEQLDVKRERIHLKGLSDPEIVEILDSLAEQLKARKRFLGVK